MYPQDFEHDLQIQEEAKVISFTLNVFFGIRESIENKDLIISIKILLSLEKVKETKHEKLAFLSFFA